MRRAVILVALVICCLWAVDAHAQVAVLVRVPDQIIDQLVGVTAGWIPRLQAYARNTYFSLATISIAWRLGRLAITGSCAEELIAELVSIIMFVGFGAFIISDGVGIAKATIDSFRQAGAVAGVGVSPSDIITAGIDIASDALDNLSFWSPAASSGLIVVAIAIAVGIAFIAGYMTIALLKSIILLPVVAFSSLFLGTEWTRDIAIRLYMQSVACGLQLLVTQLMAGGFLALLHNMVGVLKDFSGHNAIATVLAAVVMALCMAIIPDWVASAVGGSSIGEANMLRRAAMVGAAAAVGTAGVAAVGYQGAQLANTQLAASQAAGTAPTSAAGRVAAIAGGAARSIAGAAARDIGLQLAGQNRHGSAPFRMAASMANERRLRNEDLNKPRA